MREAWAGVIANFKSFLGSGWLMWLCFLVALVFCFFRMKDRRKKLFTVSVLGCVIIINPIVYRLIGTTFMSGVYWRLFWALPIVIVVAAVLTELTGKISKNWLRFVTAIVLCLTIAALGERVINRGTYTLPENDYQLPQEVIDVSDIILEANEDISTMIIVPDELVCYVRQYTGKLNLAYGRNIWGFINNPTEMQYKLHDLMNAEQIDYRTLRDEAYAYGCGYIVFNASQRELPDHMDEYGYTLVGSAEPYMIYSLEE